MSPSAGHAQVSRLSSRHTTPAEPEQLALDLPEQTFIKRKVQLGKKEKDLYNQIKRSSYAELSNGDKITATTVLTRLLRLQQLAGGFLVTDDSDKPELVNTAKLDALQDIIEDYVLGAGKKLVIFARFIPEVTAIMKMIDKTFQKTGKKQVAIYGAIKKEDRGPIIKQFQEDPDTVIIVGQIPFLMLFIGKNAPCTARRLGRFLYLSPLW